MREKDPGVTVRVPLVWAVSAAARVVLGLFACFAFASAHTGGGTAELFHGVRGDYEVWVTSRTGAPVTGPRHLNVTVLDAADRAAVPGAEVRLSLQSPGGHSSLYRARPGSSGYFFELDAVLAQPGRWRAELAVQDGQTIEHVAFSLRVLTPFQLGLSFIAIIAALLGSLALLGFGRFTRPRGRRVPETGPFTA